MCAQYDRKLSYCCILASCLYICLLVQGADTVIYERLAANNAENDSMKGVTREHMEEYGAAGLRTLCLACCELDKAVYDE